MLDHRPYWCMALQKRTSNTKECQKNQTARTSKSWNRVTWSICLQNYSSSFLTRLHAVAVVSWLFAANLESCERLESPGFVRQAMPESNLHTLVKFSTWTCKKTACVYTFISYDYLAAKSQMPLDHHAGGVPHARWEESSYCSCQGKRKPLKAGSGTQKEIWGGATIDGSGLCNRAAKGHPLQHRDFVCVTEAYDYIQQTSINFKRHFWTLWNCRDIFFGPAAGKLSCWCSACFRNARTCFRSPPPWPVECMESIQQNRTKIAR